MREYALRTGSSYDERGDRKPQSKNRPMGGPRSKRSVNLGRLGDELGMDLLGAALNLSDQALRILVEGRDHAREEQYSMNLMHKLEEAGIPLNWLDRPYAPIQPDYLRALKLFASEAKNKSPIRRANFKRIAQMFEGRHEVLGDALEMVPSSISNVAAGHLELDDQRFGHINPRLMRAGFPDAWLEAAEPDLTDAMLEALEQLATDDYERMLEEAAYEQSAQAHVSPPPQQVVSAQENLVPNPIETPKETSMAKSTPQSKQQPTQQALPSFAPPDFSAAGFPGTGAPMPHPASAAKLPRSVLAGGRKLASAPAAQAPAEPVATPKAPAKTLSLPKKAAPAPAPTPAPVAKKAAPVRGSTPTRGGVTKEVSLARAQALEALLDTARRGVKVTLWRDILGDEFRTSLPFWGNIRRGAVLFRDELADGVITAMGLPVGWLDNPTYPPATLAAWVTDPAAPLPGVGAQPAAQPAPAAVIETPPPAPAPAPKAAKAMPKPYRKTPAAAPKVTMTTPPAAPPVFEPAAVEQVAAVAKPVPVAAPEAVAVAKAPAAVAPAPAPQAPAAQVAVAGVSWAAPQGQPGPICLALISILTAKSAEGSFTEAEALGMLNSLVAAR